MYLNFPPLLNLPIFPIVSRSKSESYKSQKVEKNALNWQLKTVQILTNDVQILILCLSYFITTVVSDCLSFAYNALYAASNSSVLSCSCLDFNIFSSVKIFYSFLKESSETADVSIIHRYDLCLLY